MAKAADTLLGHCLARAFIELVGPEAAASNDTSKWITTKSMIRASPKGSRVAGFIILWTTLMRELDRDLTVEDYIEAGYDSERTSYRHNAEFRSLWPEYEYPNELGRHLLAVLDRRQDASLTMQLRIAL